MKLEISISTFVAFAAIIYFSSKLVYQIVLFFIKPYLSPLRALPGPPSKSWYFGWTTKEVRMKFGEAILENHEEYGKAFYGLTTHRTPMLYVIDEDAVNFVYQNQYNLSAKSKSELFRRPSSVCRRVFEIFGMSLFTVQTDVHKRMRKALQPAFSDSSVRKSSPLMYKVADELVEIIKNSIHGQEKITGHIDMSKLMRETALDMIGQVAFGEEFGALQEKTSKLFTCFQFLASVIPMPTFYYLIRFQFPCVARFAKHFIKDEKEFSHHRTGVENRADQLVAKAGKEAKEQSETELRTILQMVKRSSSTQITNEELRASIPALLFAGYETTTTSLTWAFRELTRCQDGLDKQAILRSELKDDENQAWRTDFAVLNKLPYLEAVCTEVLRLFPAIASQERVCMQDAVIPLSTPITLRDGVSKASQIPIKCGDTVSILFEGVNTLESLWGKDSRKFLPERWLKGEHPLYDPALSQMTDQARKLGGWNHIVTFGHGVRMCLGFRFALAEMKIVLAHCVDRFEWSAAIDPNTNEPIPIEARREIFIKPAMKGDTSGQYLFPISVKEL